MRKMKESGIAWVGAIPADWNITKGKYFMWVVERPVKEDDGVITCFRDGEVTLRSKRREDGFTIATVEAGYQGIEPGDLVVHGMDGFAGAIGISDSRGKGTPALNVLDCNGNKRYIMYFLRAMAYGEVFLALSTGIRVRTCDTNWKKLRELEYLVPSEEEQNTIVAFLDRKCANLTALTNVIQEEIETLEQYKQSVITEVVTNGLRKGAIATKESGSEWVGVIPNSWVMRKGKYLFVQRNERGNSFELQLLSPTQKFGVIPQTLYEELTGMSAVKLNENTDLSLMKTIHKGDYCISLRSFQGGFEYSEYEGVVSPAYQVFYPTVEIADGYYKYLFKEKGFIEKMNSYTMTLRDGKNIAFADFGNTYIPYPPVEEQREIAEFLDGKVAEIDAVISQKKEQLAVIENYRRSLIYEYVTGKKEVEV